MNLHSEENFEDFKSYYSLLSASLQCITNQIAFVKAFLQRLTARPIVHIFYEHGFSEK